MVHHSWPWSVIFDLYDRLQLARQGSHDCCRLPWSWPLSQRCRQLVVRRRNPSVRRQPRHRLDPADQDLRLVPLQRIRATNAGDVCIGGSYDHFGILRHHLGISLGVQRVGRVARQVGLIKTWSGGGRKVYCGRWWLLSLNLHGVRIHRLDMPLGFYPSNNSCHHLHRCLHLLLRQEKRDGQ